MDTPITTTATSGSMAELYAALAKAQGAFQPIIKNREVQIAMKTGGKYQFRYADLEEINSKTRPGLSANGLALIQTIQPGQTGPVLVCMLTHAAGGMLTSELTMPGLRDVSDPKNFGATITYLRRYMVTAMLGVAADDDLDNDGQEPADPAPHVPARPLVQPPQRRQTTVCPPIDMDDAPPSASDLATPGEIQWMNKRIAALNWTIPQALEAAGLEPRESLARLTRAGFEALKAALV